MTTAIFGGLHGRTAVVLGATGSIGTGVARILVDSGAQVALVDREPDRIEELARSLGAGNRVMTVTADVTDTAQLADARDAVLENFGEVNLVVVSVGIMLGAPFEDAVPADWTTMIDTNLNGVLLAAQTFSADLLAAAERKEQSDLVFVGAIAAHVLYPYFAVYGAVSAAIAHVTRTLRAEYGPRGLRVHNIEPGFVEESFGRHLSDGAAVDLWQDVARSIVHPISADQVGQLIAMTCGLPFGMNVAEMVLLPTEQG
jgi:NADP-dependent 3-hydroxy acid dehydrogenase YdfG